MNIETAAPIQTLTEIQSQIRALQEQERAIRLASEATVILEIKEKITQFGLTAEKLGFVLEPTVVYVEKEKEEKKKRAAIPDKFRHPENHDLTWTGQGIMPKWLTVLLENPANKGKTKYDFLIEPEKRDAIMKIDAENKKKNDEIKAKKLAKDAAAKAEETSAETPSVPAEIVAEVVAKKEDKKSKAEAIVVEDVKVIEPKRTFFGR